VKAPAHHVCLGSGSEVFFEVNQTSTDPGAAVQRSPMMAFALALLAFDAFATRKGIGADSIPQLGRGISGRRHECSYKRMLLMSHKYNHRMSSTGMSTKVTPQLQARLDEASALIEWVRASGGSADGIAVMSSQDGHGAGVGLYSTKGAGQGKVVLSIPLSLGLSAESCLRSSLGTYLAEFEPNLSDYSFIALALIHERRLGDQSPWAPWLTNSPSLLPAAGFTELPLLWGQEAISEFDTSSTVGVMSRVESIWADFFWLQENVFNANPLFFPESVFNYESFYTAVVVALSRAVFVTSPGYTWPVLLPLLDLVNHADNNPTATMAWQASKEGGLFGGATPESATLVVKSQSGVSSDQQLTMRYGWQTAGELFLTHGVLPEPLPHSCSFTFSIAEDDPEFDDKADILETEGLTVEETWVISDGRQRAMIPENMMAFMRLKHLSGEDVFILEAVFKDRVWLEHMKQPFTEENERAVLTHLASAIEEKLGRITVSYQEDLKIIAIADRQSPAYGFANIRYAERRALEEFGKAISLQLDGLKKIEYYHERRLGGLGLLEGDEVDTMTAGGKIRSREF
jgi:[ribulose-bisphosphate carboxylase]-lysine N-methyltransferase